jgi:hypothetical protein
MPDPNLPLDPEPTEPTVHELLLARIDEHCRLLGLELDQVAKACEQLAPERARSCRNALTMCRVMVDQIRLRARCGVRQPVKLGSAGTASDVSAQMPASQCSGSTESRRPRRNTALGSAEGGFAST